nr:hypothetical protein [Pseudanabaena sp. BC1403]
MNKSICYIESEREIREELVTFAIREHQGIPASLSIEGLPDFRKPAKFDGTGKDLLW